MSLKILVAKQNEKGSTAMTKGSSAFVFKPGLHIFIYSRLGVTQILAN